MTRTFQPGDRVRFIANGVEGVVTRNMGPAINTLTGNDVIEWRFDGLNVHDSAFLELVRHDSDRSPS
jgi:hypothetical protein